MGFFQTLSFLLIYIILPVAGIATLVYLIMLLNQLTKSVKRMDIIMDDVEQKLEALNGPIETVTNIHDTYLNFVSLANSAIATAQSFVNKKMKKNKKGKEE